MRKFVPFVLWLLVACSTPSARTPVLVMPETVRADSRFRLQFIQSGWYRVTAADLRAAGADPGKIDPRTFQLFNGTREIALRLLGEGNDLAFEFYGQASDSIYSNLTTDWLTWGAQPGKRIAELDSPPITVVPQATYQATVRLTQPTLYLVPPLENGAPQPESPWFWQSLAAPITTTIPLTLTAALPAPAHLTIKVWGSTQDPASPDHHLRALVNETRVLDETWDGAGARVLSATIPANVVRAGANTVRLVAPGDTQATVDIVLLQSIEATYARKLIAQDDALEFDADAGVVRVEGFSSDAIEAYDLTDRAAPVRVANANVTARAITFASDTRKHWLVVGAQARKTIARIAPMFDAKLRAAERQADYIVIAPLNLVAALQPLMAWRAQQGLRVLVTTPNEIYDEFAFGAETPEALRAFLDYALTHWQTPAPRFVLLVGKATYDYRDYLNAPNKNLVPTYLVETPHLGQAASDNWFVATDADDLPRMAIGRIPAKTAEQVTQVVNKTLAYEAATSAAWQQRAVLVTDDKDASFADSAKMLTGKLPPTWQTQAINLADHGGDVNATRPEIVQAWNAGAGLFFYIGHGSIDTWAAGPLFSGENVSALTNGDRLPILITPTCLDGYFYHPQKDSLTEDALFKRGGGIVAALAPTGLSLSDAQDTLMVSLLTELFERGAPTLGEAMQRAKQAIPRATPDQREVIDTFGILGDPALVLKR